MIENTDEPYSRQLNSPFQPCRYIVVPPHSGHCVLDQSCSYPKHVISAFNGRFLECPIIISTKIILSSYMLFDHMICNILYKNSESYLRFL